MPARGTTESWKDVVRQALEQLHGEAHLKEINKLVEGHPKTRTNPTWKDTIRRVVRQYTIFEPVPSDGKTGVYKLVPQAELPHPEADRATHDSVQGMLLRLGLLYGYETFAPSADRIKRIFQGKPLSELSTVVNCSGFCTERSARKVNLIDAIWLNEDEDGPYPAYAFEVEHSTKVRSGIDRLTEIPRRYEIPLFIVGPGEEERKLFERLRTHSRYVSFRPRLAFRDYSQLEDLFNAAARHDDVRGAFGVKMRGR